MKDKQLYLGIDTSNYKTSLAVIDDTASVVFEKSELLDVKKGSRGLRQSEAFYQHSMRLPSYISEAFEVVDPSDISAIACSDRPRRQPGSYMPCFNAGINAAGTISSVLKRPVYHFSHQEGHAAAIIPQASTDKTIFMHLSGGTTEFLICEPDDHGYNMQIAGGTKDISFGQLLDRAGVAMGYPFPSGKYLDGIAYESSSAEVPSQKIFPRVRIDEGYFNLSGAEARLMKYIEEHDIRSSDPCHLKPLVFELFRYISDVLTESAAYLSDKYGIDTLYMAGGVASSATIRELISKTCQLDIRFGDPMLSGDNAVGIALLAKRIRNL